MQSVCTDCLPKSVIGPHFSIDVNHLGNHKLGRYITYLKADFLIPHYYYASCYCNEYKGLVSRHLIKHLPMFDPDFTSVNLRRGYTKMRNCLDKECISPVSNRVLLINTRQSIYKRYVLARNNLNNRREYVGGKHASVQAIVKQEKMELKHDPITDQKAPRIIQFRSFEYLYVLKKLHLGYSIAVKKCDNIWNHQPFNTLFTKNFDNPTSCNIMFSFWNRIPDPVAVCLDHSEYDGHKTEVALSAEHDYWRSIFTASRWHRKVLKAQLKNKCVTKGGIRYTVNGTRLSGEFTTSDGNGGDNGNMLDSYCTHSGLTIYFIFVNGDDSVIIMSRSEQHKLLPMSWFEKFNQKTKLDRVANDFRNIEFCQSSPIRIDGLWRWVKKPIRTMSRCALAPYKYIRCLDRYISGVALCELATNRGVPILQQWAKMLLSFGSSKPLGSVNKFAARTSGVKDLTPTPISLETREDFSIAFDITIQQQLDFENGLAAVTLNPIEQTILKYKHFHLH
jgi:hypothetical protein